MDLMTTPESRQLQKNRWILLVIITKNVKIYYTDTYYNENLTSRSVQSFKNRSQGLKEPTSQPRSKADIQKNQCQTRPPARDTTSCKTRCRSWEVCLQKWPGTSQVPNRRSCSFPPWRRAWFVPVCRSPFWRQRLRIWRLPTPSWTFPEVRKLFRWSSDDFLEHRTISDFVINLWVPPWQ